MANPFSHPNEESSVLQWQDRIAKDKRKKRHNRRSISSKILADYNPNVVIDALEDLYRHMPSKGLRDTIENMKPFHSHDPKEAPTENVPFVIDIGIGDPGYLEQLPTHTNSPLVGGKLQARKEIKDYVEYNPVIDNKAFPAKIKVGLDISDPIDICDAIFKGMKELHDPLYVAYGAQSNIENAPERCYMIP